MALVSRKNLVSTRLAQVAGKIQTRQALTASIAALTTTDEVEADRRQEPPERLRRHTVSWQGKPHSYYQDTTQPQVFFYLPDRFKPFRQPESFKPSLRVTFTSQDDSLDRMRATLEYAAVPVVDGHRLEAAAASLRDVTDAQGEPSLEPYLADADQIRYLMHLPDGRREIDKVITDIRDGFSHILSGLTLDAFQSIFDALFSPATALFTGDVLVSMPDHGTEQIPFMARLDDLAGVPVAERAHQNLAAGRTAEAVTDHWHPLSLSGEFDNPPLVLAAIQTFVGNNAAGLRIRKLSNAGLEIKIEEEQSKDDEVRHDRESVGFLMLGSGPIDDDAGKRIGEAGQRHTDQPDGNTWHRVNLDKPLHDPVVFMQITTFNGDHPCHLRLRNVSGHGFDFQIEEWDYLNKTHVTENLSYLVLERGVHRLTDGSVLEVGTVKTDHRWAKVTLRENFSIPPIVLSQCQTVNGGQAVVTRQRHVGRRGFQVRLQEEEANDDRHKEETLGYVAVLSAASLTLRNAIESPLRVKNLPVTLQAGDARIQARVTRLTFNGEPAELPVEMAPGDELSFTVSAAEALAASGTPKVLLNADELEPLLDREALWEAILDPSIKAEYTRTIRVAGFAEMFVPHTDVKMIIIDFPRGESALIKPDQLEDAATLRIPLRDHVLKGVVQGEYRYRRRVVRIHGQETTEHTATTGVLTPQVD